MNIVHRFHFFRSYRAFVAAGNAGSYRTFRRFGYPPHAAWRAASADRRHARRTFGVEWL